MYFIDNWYKFLLAFLLIFGYSVGTSLYTNTVQVQKTEQHLKQLDKFSVELNQEHILINNLYVLGWFVVGILVFLMFLGDLRRMFKSSVVVIFFTLFLTGCGFKPFEPVKLKVINPNEEAFLLPFTGDSKNQSSSNNEQYLKENLVFTKQVKIPQQWVPKGFETFGANGSWEDSAILVKVDKSPVTREWTADPNSGTSNKNEAIWVMTADQVEFSTGWTITARIESRDDAVKFLHNYPNGSLEKVLDTEVRSKLQAEFGLEVTDLPMEILRKSATPHIQKVVKNVIEFFKIRGITITNLGISGGFIYKDKSIMDTLVRVFNSEQDKSIAIAETSAQEERNKRIIFKAQGEADALLKTKNAEAQGIKMVADARLYELDKAAEKIQSYGVLKQLELQKELLLKWDGKFPQYFMGSGNNPNMLLQLPAIEPAKK